MMDSNEHGGTDRNRLAFLLDYRVPLQLGLDTTITRTQDCVAEARILAYDFRTSR